MKEGRHNMKIKRIAQIMVAAMAFMVSGMVANAEGLNKDITKEELVKNTQETMSQVKVVQSKISVSVLMNVTASTDSNTGISYVDMGTEKMWLDQNAKIQYTYSSTTKKYEFEPISDSDEQTVNDMVNTTKVSEDYTYDGIKSFGGVECYKLTGAVSEKDAASPTKVELYVGEDYKVVGAITTYSSLPIICYFSYPESVTIPDEVKQKATLADGYTLEQGKVTYQVTYVKNKPVLYVVSALNVGKKATVADTIKICGKQYKVYGIRSGAFYNNKKLRSVTIGKNVVAIEKNAFYGCKKLNTVKIKSSKVTKIGSKAFYGTAKKLKVKVPKKKISKYKKLLKKSKVSAKLTVVKN
jgi:hypothetical protein